MNNAHPIEVEEYTYPIKPIPRYYVRRNKDGVKEKYLPRGSYIYPKQHKRCYWCGSELKGRRRSYCSDQCQSMYYNHFSWSGLRRLILARDNHRCTSCLAREPPICRGSVNECKSFLEVDHIVAVCNGGDYWDLSNLRTLCRTCHGKKTGEDVRKKNRSERKRKPKNLWDLL